MSELRITYTTALVLRALDEGLRYGFDIMDGTGLPGGTVYPVLRRLEATRLATANWEDAHDAQRRGRPTRRFYALTEAGQQALATAQDRFPALGGIALPSVQEVKS